MASGDSGEVEIAAVVEPQEQSDKTEKMNKDVESEGAGTTGDSEKAGAINPMEIQSAPATSSYVGLGKQDLLMLANRPFWVRLRLGLFIGFWLLWFGLLAAAALIIVRSPGCEDPGEDVKDTSASSHHR